MRRVICDCLRLEISSNKGSWPSPFAWANRRSGFESSSSTSSSSS
eukprot:04372.XXX_130926_131060_1 [CDS] Oithona nana genome sequencing.